MAKCAFGNNDAHTMGTLKSFRLFQQQFNRQTPEADRHRGNRDATDNAAHCRRHEAGNIQGMKRGATILPSRC
jgi:hypothetical protein